MLRFHDLASAGTALVARRALAVAASLLVLASSGWVPPADAAAPGPVPAPAAASTRSIRAPMTRRACALPGRGDAQCHAIVRTDVGPVSTRLAATANAVVSGYSPADLQSAYGLVAAAAASGSGVTVAIVDAYDSPTAEADLAAYRAYWGLPPCTSAGANPCFRKVNQQGQASPLPKADAGWALEISLDLDMVSAICPNCSILLVEAKSSLIADLGTAVNTAVALGAKYVSNSYGGPEGDSATSLMLDTQFYKHPGVVLTAATGDFGYEGYEASGGLTGNEYPSVSPWVVAVGGTTLRRAANTGWTESAWSKAGSGCSVSESRPSWQPSALTSCSRRMAADVSAVGDPDTGVAVVSGRSWYQLGGTSAAAPIVAAAYALAGTPAAGSWPGSYPYGHGGLNDPVGGNNAPGGSCSPDPALWCSGVVGYDGPTGLGSPNGTDPLGAPGLPGAPTGIGATVGIRSAQVSWSAPSSDGGNAITSYAAYAVPGGNSCTWTSGALGCTVTGLANGATYTFAVRATNSVGTGPGLAVSAPVTTPNVPGAPTGVIGQVGDQQIAVTWQAPSTDGGMPITGYTARTQPGGQTCSWTSGPLACVITGLANGSPYSLTVAATSAVGNGAPSTALPGLTPRTIPDAPTGVAAIAGNGSAQVSWLAPASNGGATITSYTATSSPEGRSCTWSAGPLDCVVTGLTNDTPYTFTVTATNEAGMGPASSPSSAAIPATVPEPPTGVVATPRATAMGVLAVTWASPADNGSPITSYQAVAYDATTFAPVTSCGTSAVAPATPATACSLTGMGNGVTVVVRVSATNGVGQSVLSTASGRATTPIPAGVATLPGWVTAPSVTVAWSASPSGVARGFDVRYRRATWSAGFGSYATWRAATTAGSGGFALAAGATYCFSVRAIDPQGVPGPWSAEQCTRSPLDDRSLVRYGSWSTGTGSAYYRSTWIRSYSYGSRVIRTSVKAKQIVLVATTCSTCGSVRVYWGSTLLRSISLYSRTTVNRRVITVATFSSVRSGTVTVKLSSSGHRVILDGLGVSAR